MDKTEGGAEEMRLLFIRHGDPDYIHDCLTERGRREAAALAEMAEELRMGEIFLSPLGRAQETASYTLKKLGKTGETREFLQEFSVLKLRGSARCLSKKKLSMNPSALETLFSTFSG